MDWIKNLFNWIKKPKNNTISFLIGSGFSKADGLPLVGEINQRLRKINEDEILIHTNGITIFLNGQQNHNAWSRKIERLFIQEFLEFYCSKVIDEEANFHYEDFYDYYYNYLMGDYVNPNLINTFCDSFINKYKDNYPDIWDNINLVSHFSDSFNQLLSSLLIRNKYYENVTPLNYPPYDDFIKFLKSIIKNNELKVHTLNHDLLFERIASVPPLWESFTDGYYEEGSPYYSEVSVNESNITKRYRVRLKYFQDRFDKKICLYKLHGSIDTYQFNIASHNYDTTRVKTDYGIEPRFVKELKIENKYEYFRGLQRTSPDFLSGTTTKLLSYSNEYYSILFKHFEKNLKKSNLLIVIGYGFGDKGINDYVEKNFLKKGAIMVVIIPKKPVSPLMNYANVKVIEKKMEHVTYADYIKIYRLRNS
jgi:SIR2-like domain